MSQLVNDAVKALQGGNREEALKLLMEAVREDRQDENAWLYLGVVVDDPVRKRQAFEQVLKINPDNDKAREQLARLEAAAAAPPPPPPGPPPPIASSPDTAARQGLSLSTLSALLSRPLRVPVQIPGAPKQVTIGGVLTRSLRSMRLTLGNLSDKNLDPLIETSNEQTPWDTYFLVFAAALAVGLAELIGRFLRGIIEIFTFQFNLGIILVTPVVAGIIALIAVAVGIAGGAYAGQLFMESRNLKVDLNRHLFMYVSAFLPVVVIEALLRLFGHIIVALTRLPTMGALIVLVSVSLTVFMAYQMRQRFAEAYTLKENDSWIVTGLTFGVGWILIRILLAVVGGIFRIGFF